MTSYVGVLDPNASVQLQEDDITKVKIKDENITKKQKSIVLKPSKVCSKCVGGGGGMYTVEREIFAR